ncbi:LysR family transcriptional regulator [Vibrio aerogenes]|nr:LysR family transcriptional regulator [Vibrio aerogenes]
MANWEGVAEFIAVAEAESFTLAATRLSTSVANISRRVAALESRLAVRLLLRTTRQVSLTEAGQLYYQQCKPLLEGLEQAEMNVTSMQQNPAGRLRVTVPVTYGERIIAPIMQDFLEQYPQLELELNLTNQRLDLIEQGIDLAIRLGVLADSSLKARKLCSRKLYVCASPVYLEKYGAPHTLKELSGHQCLLGTNDYWRFKENHTIRSPGIHGTLRCNSGVVLLSAALRGMGLIQLPDYYVSSALASGELIEVLSRYRDDREGVWALYPQNRFLSPKVRLLIDYLYRCLSPGDLKMHVQVD